MKILNGLDYLNKELSSKVFYIILAALGVTAVSLVVFSPYIPYSISINEGEVVERTIQSPRYIEFQTSGDKRKTEEIRSNRLTLIEDVYSVDEEINKQVNVKIVNFFTSLKEYKERVNSTENVEVSDALQFLSIRRLRYITNLPTTKIRELEFISIQVAERLQSQGMRRVDNFQIRRELEKVSNIFTLTTLQQSLIINILSNYLKPNMVKDVAKTEALRLTEIESIKPITTIYKEGQPIIYKGEVITREHIEVLERLNIYGVKANVRKFFGIMLLCSLCFLLLERFSYYFNYRYHSNPKYFILTYLLILLVVSLAKGIQEISFFPQNFQPYLLIPIPVATMVLSLLVTPNIALLTGSIIALLVTVMYQQDLSVFYYLFFCNSITLFSTYRKFKRTEFIFSGYVVGIGSMILVLTLGLFKEVNDLIWYGTNMILAFFNGVFASMLSLAILPYFETMFKITTHQTLLELSNLNHPLMKRLMISAPGTYQHSLMVANLSEAGAEAIGADVILTRVGAYFHDIGKLKRPAFFTENQFSIENPHNNLTPRMSKLIISSHVKDGVELAQKHKLPKILQDFILQHHGTTLVSFFYSQAVQQEGIRDEESAKDEFRYPGPKPNFKESGIVMLADSVEAAVRSMDKPTPAKIENLIERIFKSKIDDNQFEECPISMREIHIIKATFIKVFNGIYHSRLDYKKELESITKQHAKSNARK